jgi:putative DNA primase/helicase
MDFSSFLRAMGLRPRTVQPDGRWRRCPTESHPKKRNGAYKLDPSGTIGWAQDWATMESPATWKAEKTSEYVPKPDPDAMRRSHIDAMRKQRDASKRARAYYADCERLLGGHPYLDAHGLDMTGCYGLRVDRDGWLVVPARKRHEIVSYQRISPVGDKRFAPGAPIQDTSYTIDRRSAAITVICEGLATGLAIYAAIPTSRVIVAWHTSNLDGSFDVPKGWRVIAADNDHGTAERIGKNPGIEAATRAAEKLGCGVAYPEGIEGTDWADYRQEMAEARKATAGPYQTSAQTLRMVDAEINRLIMAAARFRA